MKERYRNMMEQAVLSEQAKAAFEEKLYSARPVKKGGRILRTALIAACACLALVGTAFAVEAITGIGLTEYFQGKLVSFRPGEEEKPAKGYVMDFTDVISYPIESFSEEVHHLEGAVYVEHQSWDEVEEYLGFDLMNNPVLTDPSMEPFDNLDMTFMGLSDKVHCYTRVDGYEGQMYSAVAELRRKTARSDIGTFYVELSAQVVAEHPAFAEEGDAETLSRFSTGYPEELGLEFSESQYVAPSGLTATIVATHWRSGAVDYSAHFTLNGISFYIMTGGPVGTEWPVDAKSSELTWSFMQEILDAFEF